MSYHLAQSEYEKFAYQYNAAPNMGLGLAAMARRAFRPQAIVDVGAFEGNWSTLVREIWPDSQMYLVEPNLAKREYLEGVAKVLKGKLICELLGARDGEEVKFHVMGTGSSILEERSPVPRSVETRRLRTLDSLLTDLKSPGLLKIDAQGYELEILKGASHILPAFEAILLEVAILEINAGAPLLHEVVAFMKSKGYVAYDILEIHRRPLDGAMNQVDIVFVSEQSALIADKRHY